MCSTPQAGASQSTTTQRSAMAALRVLVCWPGKRTDERACHRGDGRTGAPPGPAAVYGGACRIWLRTARIPSSAPDELGAAGGPRLAQLHELRARRDRFRLPRPEELPEG